MKKLRDYEKEYNEKFGELDYIPVRLETDSFANVELNLDNNGNVNMSNLFDRLEELGYVSKINPRLKLRISNMICENRWLVKGIKFNIKYPTFATIELCRTVNECAYFKNIEETILSELSYLAYHYIGTNILNINSEEEFNDCINSLKNYNHYNFTVVENYKRTSALDFDYDIVYEDNEIKVKFNLKEI